MKKTFSIPFLLPLEDGGDDTVIGGGTGQGGVPTTALSYTDWLNSQYAEDLIGQNGIDEVDYGAWWEGMMELDPEGFSEAVWSRLNPGLDFGDYVG